MKRRPHPDLIAVLALVALWLLFFWRLFTPIAADQASLQQGDLSGQFVAFGAYQYARFAQGEIPLWNPYNNGGLPFIADTQAAVFYPPRLLTIALARLAGGWSYHALELEMTAHVLLYALAMYALIRRMTRGQRGSVFGAFVAAVIAGYGGFPSGYAPLQLAILEAAVWLPLGVLGVFEAVPLTPNSSPIPHLDTAVQGEGNKTGVSVRWRWLVIAGFALGLSWMAGHPQTSYFLTLLLVVYFGCCCYAARVRWTQFVAGAALFGAVAFGMAAVQLVPGVEYLLRTSRAGYGYDAKSNGFPVQDVIQFIFPGVVSLYSPLYVGVVGFALALVAVGRRLPQSLFWGLVALAALLWSFGGNGAMFPLLYNLLPGLRYFRGQERAAYLVVNSLAILAGLGAAHLASWDVVGHYPAVLRLRVWLNRAFVACLVFAALVFVAWLGSPQAYGGIVSPVILSTIVVGLLYLLLPASLTKPESTWLRWGIAALLVVELFTVNMDASAVYDPVPPAEQLSLTPPPLVAQVKADTDAPFRVDGFRGVLDNYGSLYEVMDIRGISPLFLNSAWAVIGDVQTNPLAWELFAVRYVFTDWQELPVPGEIVGTGEDRFGAVNLHRLTNPRPFALLVYAAQVVESDEAALARLRDPAFQPRETVLLDHLPDVRLPDEAPQAGAARVTEFAPEAFAVEVSTPQNALLSLAQVDYPGWYAALDGAPADILRAYGGLSAVIVPQGEHTVRFVYNPLSYRVGALISAATWAGLAAFAVILLVRRKEGKPHPLTRFDVQNRYS